MRQKRQWVHVQSDIKVLLSNHVQKITVLAWFVDVLACPSRVIRLSTHCLGSPCSDVFSPFELDKATFTSLKENKEDP